MENSALNISLSLSDTIVIGLFFIVLIIIALASAKKSKAGVEDYFLGGRKMPWWLLGISMVACTFSADTPNLVSGMVRETGVAKNWAWWSFLITGMTTVFIFAKLWRRTGIVTDLEFYEKRYAGKAAGFLRSFRAVYLGFFFNVLIIGSVTLAAIKIGAVVFGLSPLITVVCGSLCAVIYTSLGGFRGVVWADFFQYIIAMAGAIVACIAAVNLPEVGGLNALVNNDLIADKISFFPDLTDPSVFIPLLIIPIAVQWWAVWYPGSEPGGGGYMCQKMLSAKDEKHSVAANLFFNFAHYALRPWPWILVGLASLIVFTPDSISDRQNAENELNNPQILPYYQNYLKDFNAQNLPENIRQKVVDLHFQKEGLSSLHKAVPKADGKYLKDDIAYPVMITKTPSGWFGLIIASLIAAYLSTIATHLNWGASYLVNDFYRRFLRKNASDKELKKVAILCTVLLAFFGGLVSLTVMDNATQAFDILLLSGAGTGAVYLLRWFWKRINAQTEIAAMVSAFVMSVVMVFVIPDGCLKTNVLDHNTMRLLITVLIVTVVWLVTVFVTKPEEDKTLTEFFSLTKSDDFSKMPKQILCVFLGILTVYSCLFSIGYFVMLKPVLGVLTAVIAVTAGFFTLKTGKEIL